MFTKFLTVVLSSAIITLTSCSSAPSVYTPNGSLGLTGKTYEGISTSPETEQPGGGITTSTLPQGEIILGDPLGTPVTDHPFNSSNVYFAYDSAVIGTSYDDLVKALASYIQEHPNYILTIGGHCDERGSDEYNRSLGERRAMSVREALLSMGLSAERVSTMSYGEDQPDVIGNSNESYSKNRRANFKVFEISQ